MYQSPHSSTTPFMQQAPNQMQHQMQQAPNQMQQAPNPTFNQNMAEPEPPQKGLASPDEFQHLLAYIALGWTGVCVLLWIVLLTGPFHWHSKLTLWYTVDAGLWHAKLSHGVVTGAVQEVLTDDQRAWVKKLVFKTESIGDFQQRMCAPLYRNTARLTGSNVCQIWIKYIQGTYAFLFFTILGLIFLVIGGVLMYRHYMRSKSRSKIRACMKGWVIAGPVTISIGLIIYLALTQDFADMPPRRKSDFGANWGVTTGMACLLTVATYGPLVLSYCCLGDTTGEVLGDADHQRKKDASYLAATQGFTQSQGFAQSQAPVQFAQPQLAAPQYGQYMSGY